MWGITVQPLSHDLASHFSLPAGRGVLVADVADIAGGRLVRGDIILSVNGSPVEDLDDFEQKVQLARHVTLRVQRGGREVDVPFAEIR